MPRSTATAVAAGCGLLAAPLFVAPSSVRPPMVRVVAEAEAGVQQGAGSAVPGQLAAVAPLLGLGAMAALVASRSRARAQPSSLTRAAFNPEAELGVQAPVRFWDPAGFCNDGDEAKFRRRRVVEIKHGRVSMLACIGYIVPEYVRFPGYLSPSEGIKFSEVPNGLAALSKVPALGWAQMITFIGFVESGALSRFGFKRNPSDPSDLGLGFLGACGLLGSIKDPKVKAQKLNAEIANGRLAMFAIIALFFQNGVTGTTGPELYGFGENSGTIWLKVLFPTLAAFGIMGETFRRGPDEKFLKLYKRNDYFGYDKRI